MQQRLDWQQRPDHLSLPKSSEIHLWRLDLNTLQNEEDILSEDERARIETMNNERIQRRFVNSRCGLRLILADYLNCAPASIRFDYNEKGKPSISGGEPSLEFNMSHADDMAIIAVSALAIGVDIEPLRDRPGKLRIAQRLMGEEFCSHLESLDEHNQAGAFLLRWTKLEASVKALGVGVFDQGKIAESLIQTCAFQPKTGWVGHIALLDSSPKEKKWVAFTWP